MSTHRQDHADLQRDQLATTLLGVDYAGLSEVQRSVIDLIVTGAPTGVGPLLVADDRTFWERLADRVAAVGGSWTFLAGFGLTLAVWVLTNLALAVFGRAFDPYPFIFLNLLLSMLAAVQAPVIMMSQNRQSAKDRSAAEHDYVVNLRAELEIMHLHDKLDALRDRELVELLRRQTETLELLKAQIAALSPPRPPGG